MSLPSRLDLSGFQWDVRIQDPIEMPDCFGRTTFEDYSIELRNNLHVLNQTDTFVHEVFHAILSSQGRPPGGNVEETYVRALATGLVGALRSNPELRDWLHQATTT